jgi:hypothetical protein
VSISVQQIACHVFKGFYNRLSFRPLTPSKKHMSRTRTTFFKRRPTYPSHPRHAPSPRRQTAVTPADHPLRDSFRSFAEDSSAGANTLETAGIGREAQGMGPSNGMQTPLAQNALAPEDSQLHAEINSIDSTRHRERRSRAMLGSSRGSNYTLRNKGHMKTRLLYKFMRSEHALSFLDDGFIKIATLNDLNDPYDLVPCIPDASPGFGVGAERWRTLSLAWLSERHGLMCMSSTCADPVLWAHYADGHRGVALELNPEDDPNLIDVEYADDRVVIPFEKIADPSRFLPVDMLALLRRKCRSWQYEKEVRFVMPLELCTRRGDIFMLPLPDGFLHSIILGYRCPLDEHAVRQKLDRGRFSSAVVKRAHLSDRTFAIHAELSLPD